ncbi:MAG TPA: Asp-tRNA(Asn)/Glu-tRNA(Gln) amidotransferase subunit GatB [Solirubrobacterales bacterium]|nr:Asp-tRNA(Asn)/Glu-tRNA(Gln) amidotransferase subunit GatB [Solirubrobacterales bacterium]HMU26105.1 Asp-tRNA(Asn)/Glu-tRNA(Gln) amidotransferase subunit GatB [Solirubrobacterales bacterium]HMW45224.1 Asp-tRNA(Asn)/Glu-tRNA(Gln) amidotransferase subunit GatB [Solirubrobacterales bacterium]HMX71541.1 Asp-tRNA(Asn)/Glu-tRNA(Gln) amidotransferase subunit GatB [Solirubrobacterales bacterium]HMY26041.1 Asp-tRNA(Asn)/Glu-tRNA(Gln) amidotransferase subunit GatB [Solirubrobacterales bacterium]
MSTEYEAVIGLEIHVQLSTRTKMFCGCELSFGDDPNVHTCPVCLALPGVLPVPNAQAIEYALQIGAALGCELSPVSTFDRKNYFYPDNPKAYQITQAARPFAVNGRLGEVRIHHAHLEEDAAKTIHTGGGGRIKGSDASEVDFNRGGTPLVEIVTEPDLRSGAQVREWGQLLRATIKQLGVSDVNMEEGSLRCDANVSIRPVGSTEFGTKTEMKNMNSFRFIERGIEAEVARQKEVVASGGQVVQETLHFDPATGELHSLRSKEEAHDYRYLPEPDLVPVVPTPAMLEEAASSLPELPAARAARYEGIGVSEQAALLLSFELEWAGYFEGVLAADQSIEPRVAANWVTGEFAAELRKQDDQALADSKVGPESLATLIGLVQAKKISHGAGKTVLEEMVASGTDPVTVVAEKGLEQIADSGELEKIVIQAIEDNPKPAEQVREGNEKAIGALVGAVMKATQGRADGGEVNRLLRQHLGL